MKIISKRAVSFGMFSKWLRIAYFEEKYFDPNVPPELVERLLDGCKKFQDLCVRRMEDGRICFHSTPLDFGTYDRGFSCPKRCEDVSLLAQHKALLKIYKEFRIHNATSTENIIRL